MTDDQFKEFIAALMAPKKEPASLLRKAVDATVLALIVGVTLGFFTMIWEGHRGYGKAIHSLEHSDRILEIKNKVSMELLAKEVISLQEEHDRAYDGHNQEIDEMRQVYRHMLSELRKKDIAIPPPPRPSSAAKKVDPFDHVGSPLKVYEDKKKRLFDRFRDEVRQQVQQIGSNVSLPEE